MDFAAIDFETATRARDSACSIAVVRVAKGAVAETFSAYIRPPGNRYSAFHTSIHGIAPADTADAPDFAALWERLAPKLSGAHIVAHNAPFDIGVLKACLLRYDLPWPSFFYADTVVIARRAWPHLPNHKLTTVAAHLGIRFCHHDALEDARACAAIVLAASRAAEDLRALLGRLGAPLVPF